MSLFKSIMKHASANIKRSIAESEPVEEIVFKNKYASLPEEKRNFLDKIERLDVNYALDVNFEHSMTRRIEKSLIGRTINSINSAEESIDGYLNNLENKMNGEPTPVNNLIIESNPEAAYRVVFRTNMPSWQENWHNMEFKIYNEEGYVLFNVRRKNALISQKEIFEVENLLGRVALIKETKATLLTGRGVQIELYNQDIGKITTKKNKLNVDIGNWEVSQVDSQKYLLECGNSVTGELKKMFSDMGPFYLLDFTKQKYLLEGIMIALSLIMREQCSIF